MALWHTEWMVDGFPHWISGNPELLCGSWFHRGSEFPWVMRNLGFLEWEQGRGKKTDLFISIKILDQCWQLLSPLLFFLPIRKHGPVQVRYSDLLNNGGVGRWRERECSSHLQLLKCYLLAASFGGKIQSPLKVIYHNDTSQCRTQQEPLNTRTEMRMRGSHGGWWNKKGIFCDPFGMAVLFSTPHRKGSFLLSPVFSQVCYPSIWKFFTEKTTYSSVCHLE